MSTMFRDFNEQEFRAPAGAYAPVYGWFWNGPLSKEKTEAQILEMQRLGVRAFYIVPEPQAFRPTRIPTTMDPNYLTDGYFEHFRFAMEKAKELGMECWIYDEGGWPSGGACGQVMLHHPELARRSLSCRKVHFAAGETFRLSDGDSAAAFLCGKMLEEGFVFPEDAEVDEYFSAREAFRDVALPDLPDLTRPESTDVFIEMTHERYKEKMGDLFGNTITAVFTDEPAVPAIPFRPELCRMYEEKYGESILPHLPVLLGREQPNAENAKYLRRWYDLSSRVFADSFFLKCRKWCNDNGMKFTGHLGGEDEPLGCLLGRYYHVMRILRCMDLPGVDVIWRQIFPGGKQMLDDPEGKLNAAGGVEFGQNYFFPRYASSAAAQIGENLSVTESFGVYGYGMSYEQMRYVIGFQSIRGINIFNPLPFSYARYGHLLTGEAPAFAEYQAFHCDLPVFNRYMERLTYLFTRGKRVCDTALYYPVHDFWGKYRAGEAADAYNNLGWGMEALGVDFDIVDDDVILASDALDRGIIAMGDAAYTGIVIQPDAYLPPEVEAALRRFTAGGGRILRTKEEARGVVPFTGGDGMLRFMRRVTESGELLFIFNEDKECRSCTVEIGGKDGYRIDAEAGELLPLVREGASAHLTLESGETAVLYLGESIPALHIPPEKNSVRELTGPFSFCRTKSFVIGEMTAASHDVEEEPAELPLGDWSAHTGRDFSGSGVYTAHFAGVGANALLDLGDVRYSCEVFVNGESLGIRVVKPYRFEIPVSLMREDNLLEIRVSNTPGNQHHYTKSFDKWGSWMLTPYKIKQDLFDRDTLDSGLYGPVRMYW